MDHASSVHYASSGFDNNFFNTSPITATVATVTAIALTAIGVLATMSMIPDIGGIGGGVMAGSGVASLVMLAAFGCRSESPTHIPVSSTSRGTGKSFETPPSNPTASALPTTVFTSCNKGINKWEHWKSTTPKDGNPDMTQQWPVAASPGHLQQGGYFRQLQHQKQKIVFHDGSQHLTSIDFHLQPGTKVMKPNLDTMLLCHGINCLQEQGVTFSKAIDVGSGSGFIAKHLALKNTQSTITAIDIDQNAITYMKSPGADLPINVEIVENDATTYLESHASEYDLVVSNPPYVPTVQETQSNALIEPDNPNFWSGTGLICHMLEKTLPQMKQGSHVVMIVPSTALKSKRVAQLLNKQAGFSATILAEQEVAYKAYYLGGGSTTHLKASSSEAKKETRFEGISKDLFVGITGPGKPRSCDINDGRKECQDYHWQVLYVIDFVKK